MNEDKLNKLLERCQSPIESELLQNLYPHLTTDRARELRVQHKIDRYDDMRLTIPDFAFPDMQIAIYCDGFAPREGDQEKFRRDRLQSRELQLKGWIVLRFAGSEINREGEMVVETIQRAIARRDRQRNWRRQQQQQGQQESWAHQKPEGRRSQQQQPPPIRQEEKSWQESMQEWRNEKEQPIPARQDHQRPQTQQKPGGGMCGVIFLASVIVGVLVLLDFIF